MPNETVHENNFDQLNTATFLATTLVIVQVGIFEFFHVSPSTPKKFLVGDRDNSNTAICTSVAIQAAPHALLAVTWAFLPGLEIVHLASAFGVLVAGAITILLYTPLLYDMSEDSISIYAYLQERFNSPLPRRLVSSLYVAESSVMLAVHMHAPSLTISEVSGIPVEVCIWLIILGAFATSVLSGIRGLLRTNLLQVIFVLGALLAVLYEANNADGALSENANNHVIGIVSKLNGWTFAASLVAWSAHWILHFVSDQSFAQKAASAKSQREARLSVGISSLMMFFFMIVGSLVGTSLKGAHAGQDLFETHRPNSSSDQVIYIFVKQAYGNVPGLPGLLMGMLFNAYIGCAASLCNGITSTLFHDIAEPGFNSQASELFRSNVARFLGVVPLLASSVVALVTYFVGVAPSILLNLTGCVGGPIISLFSVGLLSSRYPLTASLSGAISGMFVAFLASWICYRESSHSLSHSEVFSFLEEVADEEVSTGEASDTSLREWFQVWSASMVWVELLSIAVSVLITVLTTICIKSAKPNDSDWDVASRVETSDMLSRARRKRDPEVDLTSIELKTPD